MRWGPDRMQRGRHEGAEAWGAPRTRPDASGRTQPRRRDGVEAQLELRLGSTEKPRRGGRRKNAGRKRADPDARPNVPHRKRPVHVGRHPVHVTMRLAKGVPKLRNQLAREVFRRVLVKQTRRPYSREFQVVHFSIQDDHVHLIVEAFVPSEPGGSKKDETKHQERDGMALRRGGAAGASSADVAQRHERDGMALRRGVSGLAISFARSYNRALHRKGGKVWGDRHHRRDLQSPTEVRSTLLYVLQNWRRHGMRVFGDGVVDPYSSALRFEGWADPHVTIVETEPWPNPRPRTWLLAVGWTRAGGLLRTSDVPPAARSVRYAPIVSAYVPSSEPRTP